MDVDRGPCKSLIKFLASLLTYGTGKDIHSYIKAAADCEQKWIASFSDSHGARNQLGARHTASQHMSLLNQWLSLAPAVLPSPEHCTATLSHPDLLPIYLLTMNLRQRPRLLTGKAHLSGRFSKPQCPNVSMSIPALSSAQSYPMVISNDPSYQATMMS